MRILLIVSLFFLSCTSGKEKSDTMMKQYNLTDFYGENPLLDQHVEAVFSRLGEKEKIGQMIITSAGTIGQPASKVEKMIKEKTENFNEERKIKRQKARKIFDSLHEEDQNNLLQEFDHAKEDPSFKKLGGELEDFLILNFKLKITLFEGMKSVHKIKTRLPEIKSYLDEVIYRWKKDEIEWTEFVTIYRATENELNLIDTELKRLEVAYR